MNVRRLPFRNRWPGDEAEDVLDFLVYTRAKSCSRWITSKEDLFEVGPRYRLSLQ